MRGAEDREHRFQVCRERRDALERENKRLREALDGVVPALECLCRMLFEEGKEDAADSVGTIKNRANAALGSEPVEKP